jgi:hypothetical protein
MGVEPAFKPDRVVAALNAAGVEYVVIGGLAAGAHGVVRATRDLEVDTPPMRLPDNVAGLAWRPLIASVRSRPVTTHDRGAR